MYRKHHCFNGGTEDVQVCGTSVGSQTEPGPNEHGPPDVAVMMHAPCILTPLISG